MENNTELYNNKKKSSPLTNPNKPIKILKNIYSKQVVYIPPNMHKMKIRKTNFATFSGRSV